MTAYNHNTQTWVEGIEGAKLLLQQLRATLALAMNKELDGAKFARASGWTGVDELCFTLRREIAECEQEIAQASHSLN